MTLRQTFVLISTLVVAALVGLSFISTSWLWGFVLVAPIILIGIYDMFQTKKSILRLYPVLGHFRYILESVRPEIQQYFVETETSGTPIPREYRSLIYQRAKGDRDTRPFGSIFDASRPGYEWVNHSIVPKHLTDFCLLYTSPSPRD